MEPITMIMGAVGLMQGIAGNSQAKAQARAHNQVIEANMKANVMSANYQMAELERQQQVAMDAATEELIQQRIIAMENEAQVAAAAGETGLSGNSMNTAVRSVQARYGRSASSIMANADREIMGLQSQQETIARDVNQANKIAAMGGMAKPSGAQQLMNIGTSALKGMEMGAAMGSQWDSYFAKGKTNLKIPSTRSRLGKDNR